jgi:hypothetical protein
MTPSIGGSLLDVKAKNIFSELKMRKPSLFILLSLGLLISFSLAAANDIPQVTPDGLHLVPDTQLRLVYADPDADLSIYSKFFLIYPQVAFRNDWRRDINQNKPYLVTTEDMQNIRSKLAGMFREILLTKLEAGQYTVVEEQAADVLIIRPAILDLNISSPETPRSRNTRSITRSVGDMKLYLELRDSLTGDILAKALDHQADRSNVTIYMTDGNRNEKAARRILEGWADILVNGLNETMLATSGRQEPSEE